MLDNLSVPKSSTFFVTLGDPTEKSISRFKEILHENLI